MINIKPQKILLLGGGGHFNSCVDVIEASSGYEIFGIVLPKHVAGHQVLGYPVVGCDEDLEELLQVVPIAFVCVGQIRSHTVREVLFNKIKDNGGSLARIIAPTSYCSDRASIGEGTILMHHSFVNANAVIGENCIINTSAIVEHDVSISNHCHISTGARINGSVHIGKGCFIGSGAIICEGVTIGECSRIGAGQVVREDVPSGASVRNSL